MNTRIEWIPSRSSAGRNQAAAADSAAIDVDRIALTLDRALAHRLVLPPYEELADLEQLLRGHIQLLVPIVQADTDRMPRGIPAWEQRQATLDVVPHLLGHGLGEGLMSAASVHVHELGRCCRFLLDYYLGMR